jgi:Subtilase family
VLAAGNEGRSCNADHYLARNQRLIYATALDSAGRPASYSNRVEGEWARSLAAFGGDPDAHVDPQGILAGDQHIKGTSFAAPLVSSVAPAWLRDAAEYCVIIAPGLRQEVHDYTCRLLETLGHPPLV